MDEEKEVKKRWTTYSKKSTTNGKEFADLLTELFANTSDLNYSSRALLVMAQRFQELLAAGVSEEEIIAHCREELPAFSQKLIRGTQGKKGRVLVEPAVVDARLIRSVFLQCPKPPTWPILQGAIRTTSGKKVYVGQQKAGTKA